MTRNKGGRRGKYLDWITADGLKRIESFARDGLSNAQIAKNIGCHPSTFQEWLNRFPEIREALKNGKRPVDFEVENTLLKRALGFEYEEVEQWIEVVDGVEKKRQKKIIKYALPDTGAAIFWLKNRKPDVWRRMSPEFKRKVDAETRKLEAEADLALQQTGMLEMDTQVIIVDEWDDDDDE